MVIYHSNTKVTEICSEEQFGWPLPWAVSSNTGVWGLTWERARMACHWKEKAALWHEEQVWTLRSGERRKYPSKAIKWTDMKPQSELGMLLSWQSVCLACMKPCVQSLEVQKQVTHATAPHWGGGGRRIRGSRATWWATWDVVSKEKCLGMDRGIGTVGNTPAGRNGASWGKAAFTCNPSSG